MKTGPFRESASGYTAQGWPVVPVEVGGKRIAVDGWTGHDGKYPTLADVRSFARTYPLHNIAIRMPYFVVGIDVDAYDDKSGLETIQELERELGALPATYVSTSRDDGISGIRLYRVPAVNSSYKGKAGPGVDVICWHYRYIVAAPSVHPEGGTYAWYIESDGNSELSPCDPPAPSDLPDLPEAWLEFLHREAASSKTGKLLRADITAWLKKTGAGEPCEMMTETSSHWIELLHDSKSDGGAHDLMLSGVKAIIGDAVAGHTGMYAELTSLRNAFIDAVKSRRDNSAIDTEWRRAVYGAVRMHYESTVVTDDSCTDGSLDFSNIRSTNGRLLTPDAMRATRNGKAASGEDAKYKAALNRELTRLRINGDAKRFMAAEHAVPLPNELMLVSKWLERDIKPPRTLVPGLIALDGSTMVVAQPKAGKTTLVHNLVRSIACEEPFLDAFNVNPIPDGKQVVLLDFEMNEGLLMEWVGKQGIDDNAVVHSLDGKAGSFDILDPFCLAKWAKLLEAVNAGYLIIDCLAPALASLGVEENSNTEVGQWLNALRTLQEECGAFGLMIIHHTGRVGEHARGASRLEGWTSDNLRLTLDGNGEDDDGKYVRADRFLSARGRIVDPDFTEVMLSHDNRTHRLTVGGSDRVSVAADRVQPDVIAYITANPGCTKNSVEKGVSGRAAAIRKALYDLMNECDDGDISSVCDHGKPRMPSLFYGCKDPSFHTAKVKLP